MKHITIFFKKIRSVFASESQVDSVAGGSGQLDPATLHARRALAEKLKLEVIGKDEEE